GAWRRCSLVRLLKTCSSLTPCHSPQPALARCAWSFQQSPKEGTNFMKQAFAILCLAAGIGVFPANAQVNVTQEHNHLSTDGLYIHSVFTPANAANLMRDLGFDGTISGNVYAQPLYIEGSPNGPMVIAVTESNNVYALDANDGSIIWQRNLGPAVTSELTCGNINPLGISGTPAIDPASRSLFIDAM